MELVIDAVRAQQRAQTKRDQPPLHIRPPSGLLEEESNRGREPLPAFEFSFELPAPLAGEGVELRASAEIRIPPRGRDPASLLEPVQRGIERSLSDRQDVAGERLHAFRNAPAVERLA